jgi:hypothetical protein
MRLLFGARELTTQLQWIIDTLRSHTLVYSRLRMDSAGRWPPTYWLTGNTMHVEGGENIVG